MYTSWFGCNLNYIINCNSSISRYSSIYNNSDTFHTLLIIGIERIATGIAPLPSRSSRIANIGLGALAIAVAVAVISFPVFTAGLLVTLAAISLLFVGIARIVQGARNKDAPGWSRGFMVGVGVLSIAVSLLVIAHPISFGVVLLGFMISIALLINGIQMIALGIGGRMRYKES
jgi:uncharacterized membrane protein HdeD (DUF308 family)